MQDMIGKRSPAGSAAGGTRVRPCAGPSWRSTRQRPVSAPPSPGPRPWPGSHASSRLSWRADPGRCSWPADGGRCRRIVGAAAGHPSPGTADGTNPCRLRRAQSPEGRRTSGPWGMLGLFPSFRFQPGQCSCRPLPHVRGQVRVLRRFLQHGFRHPDQPNGPAGRYSRARRRPPRAATRSPPWRQDMSP